MKPARFLVGGEWKESPRVKPIVNPFNDARVGEVCLAGPEDVDAAIGAAVSAFPKIRALASYERSAILSTMASAIERNKEDFARSITQETGKPVTFSRAEVDRSVLTFSVAAEEARRMEGTVIPLDLAPHSKGRFGLVRRFPLGPVAAITPFNFPLNLVAHKVAPAIAAGNPVVLKPSSWGILTALRLAEQLLEAGLPPGAINVVPCTAGEADQLVVDQRIKLLSFTGSPAVGWGMKSRAGKKRVTLELGGNAGVIVDTGTSLDIAVPRIAAGGFGNAGQSCIAVQRIFVHEDLYADFERRLVEASAGTRTGDPEDESTVVGPMITRAAAEEAERWIAEAVQGGARLLCGGGRNGAVLQPTVLTHVRPEMRVSCQEVFAPIVTLDPFRDFEDAVRLVNNTAFGLQAGIYSRDMNHIMLAYEALDVGGVIVNDFPTYRIDHMPYGGVKDSGFGREGIRYAMEEMTELKLLAYNTSV